MRPIPFARLTIVAVAIVGIFVLGFGGTRVGPATSDAQPIVPASVPEVPQSDDEAAYAPERLARSVEDYLLPHPTGGGPGGDLIDAGFESGFAGWNMDGVGDVRPTISSDIVETGSSAGRVVLTGTQSRSELMLDGSGGTASPGTVKFYEGDERYYAFSFLIRSMVYGHPGAHNTIMQFHSGDGAPFGLMLWDYAGDGGAGGGRGLWTIGGSMGGNRFLAPTQENRWYDVVIHFKASRQGTGSYEVYLNGKPIDSRNNVSMIDPTDTSGYLKTGLYRNGTQIPGTSEIRLDSARLGTTMAQVTAP